MRRIVASGGKRGDSSAWRTGVRGSSRPATSVIRLAGDRRALSTDPGREPLGDASFITTGKTSNSIKSSQRAVHCARSARSSHSMIWKQRRKSSVTQVATYRKPLRHESALVAKAPVHRQRVTVPKVLDDHVLHPASLS